MNKLRNNKGFTLVEIIVVLVILAILAAFLIPSLTGYIEKAKKNKVLYECRQAVMATQTLFSQDLNEDGVSNEEIKTLSEVDGDISNIKSIQRVVTHLTYTKSPWVVIYCKNWETCPLHSEMYNISKNDDDSGNGTPETQPPLTEDTPDYFYIAGNSNYKVRTLGELESYDFGQYGSTVPNGSVFYWKGKYYYTRQSQYLTNSSDRAAYINTYGVKVDTGSLKTPGVTTQPGDLKTTNGKVYVFFPYQRHENDYADSNYWLEVAIE